MTKLIMSLIVVLLFLWFFRAMAKLFEGAVIEHKAEKRISEASESEGIATMFNLLAITCGLIIASIAIAGGIMLFVFFGSQLLDYLGEQLVQMFNQPEPVADTVETVESTIDKLNNHLTN